MSDWRGALADFVRVATARGRGDVGAFALEGCRLHERALAADASLRVVVAAEEFGANAGSREGSLLSALERRGVPLRRAPADRLAAAMEGRGGGAIVGLAALPQLPDLDAFRERLDAGSGSGIVLVGVDIEDPGNVGALIRTALASCADAYVRCGLGDPFHPRAVRTSMGSLFRLPLVDGGAPAGLPKRLRAAGYRSLGAVARGGATPEESFAEIAPDDVAVLLGSEAFGLDEDTVHLLDSRVSIPMPEGVVDSFSVNAAAAILLWERRRR